MKNCTQKAKWSYIFFQSHKRLYSLSVRIKHGRTRLYESTDQGRSLFPYGKQTILWGFWKDWARYFCMGLIREKRCLTNKRYRIHVQVVVMIHYLIFRYRYKERMRVVFVSRFFSSLNFPSLSMGCGAGTMEELFRGFQKLRLSGKFHEKIKNSEEFGQASLPQVGFLSPWSFYDSSVENVASLGWVL